MARAVVIRSLCAGRVLAGRGPRGRMPCLEAVPEVAMAAGKSVEIVCTACGAEALLVRRPKRNKGGQALFNA